MFSRIYVPLDNSDHSNAAAEVAVALGSAFGATCIGSHVYAARMHDYRFKQMEYTLPEEYQDEAELLRQRRIHDSLITTGLQLISDSYTDVMRYRCLEAGVPFESRMIDGRNWEEIVRDVRENQYDLVVMGALGMGAVKESLLGGVTERVMRRLRTDLMIVRRTGTAAMDGPILVAIDGSPQSFGGLRTGLALARALNKPIEAVAVYDPYLHYAVFNSIVDVLSEKASKVFRFKEQEALHEEIIDTGLAKIYESHLKVARATAAEEGVDLPITLLDGKAFERVLRYAREVQPWLLIAGRIGVHSDDVMDIGSNSEQLVRLAPCNILLSSRTHVPPIDVRADASVVWTPEAEQRMQRVPVAARGIARTAVLRWATERGHSVIASGDVDAALDELMPYQRTMRRFGEVAQAVERAERAMVDEAAVTEARAVCRTCGYAARVASPAECPVCGGGPEGFEHLDVTAMLESAADEGDAAETGFDGRKLGWTLDARTVLHQLPAGYLRRRVKAIVEKAARTRRLPAITRDFVEPYVLPELDALDGNAGAHRAPIARDAEPVAAPAGQETLPAEGLLRRLPWTLEAESRLERIPEGFLRNLAREQVERIALGVGAREVTALHVEAGIAEARERMRAAIGPSPATEGVPAGCPVHTASSARARDGDAAAEPATAATASDASVTPATGSSESPVGDIALSGCPVPHGARGSAAAPEHSERDAAPAAPTVPAAASGCPVPHGDGAAAGSGIPPEVLERIAQLSRESGKFDPERAREMAAAAASARAQLGGLNEVTAGFVESLGKKLGYGHPASPITHELSFTWTPEAEARLEAVPDFCREMVRWRVEWFARKRGLGDVITPEMVDGKVQAWGRVSEEIEARGMSMPWSEAARTRLERIPASVRGEVMQAIEGNARAAGADRVEDAHLDAMVEQWQRTGDFHQGRFGFKA